MYDNVRKTLLDDETIESIAKAQIGGADLPVTKSDWMVAISERADEIYGELQLSKEARFSKAIGGSAEVVRGSVVNAGDRLCKLYYEAKKTAPRAPAEAPERPVDIAKAMAKRSGKASEQMLELAKEYKKSFPAKSDAAAYVAVYGDPKNIALKERVLAEHLAATMSGVTPAAI